MSKLTYGNCRMIDDLIQSYDTWIDTNSIKGGELNPFDINCKSLQQTYRIFKKITINLAMKIVFLAALAAVALAKSSPGIYTCCT